MIRIVLMVLCYQHVISQPLSTVSDRFPREVIECCPCPKDGQDWLPGAKDSQAWLGDGQQARVDDDCPCRARAADSDAASSLFFPTALRSDGSQHRSIEPKEETKNLLEPEVNLATSVLDTLREVTEEEYRDAVDREAARNAADPDAVPEESARNVVIVINPKDSENNDDFIAGTTHAHESRCIHPIGCASLGNMRSSTNPINNLPNLFKSPKLKQLEPPQRNLLHLDSNFGASNIEKGAEDPNGNTLKKIAEAIEIRRKPLKDLLGNGKDISKIPKFDLNLEKFNNNKPVESSKLFLRPDLKSSTKIFDDNFRSVSIDEQYRSEPTIDKSNQLIENDKFPLALRNLLKLRDVELIPKTIGNKPWTKPNLDISKFAVPTLLISNQNENCNVEDKYLENGRINLDRNNPEQITLSNLSDDITNDSEIKEADSLTNPGENLMFDSPLSEIVIESISDENIKGEEINNIGGAELNFDTFSSPSEMQPIFVETANEVMDIETVELPKSDCKPIDIKESDTNNEEIKILIESPENDSNVFEIVNANFAPEDDISIMDDRQGDEFLPNQDINQDSETENSNNILFTLEPLDNNANELTESERNTETDFESLEKHVAGSKTPTRDFTGIFDSVKVIPNVKEMTSSLSDTLSNLKDHVVKHIENLKTPLSKSHLLGRFSKSDNIIGDKEKGILIDENNRELIKNLNPRYNAEMKNTENMTNISMNDLQNMSDTLLEESKNDQRKLLESTVSSIKDNTNSKPSEINDYNQNKLSETKSSIVDDTKKAEENACPTDLKNKDAINNEEDAIKSMILDTQTQEMDTGASNTVINTLPGILDSINPNLNLRSPSLSDIGLPVPIDPLNLLGKPLEDVLNLNTNLPTLDDLRERLVNIFNPDNESPEIDSSSLEADFSNDSPLKTMATEASTRSSQKESPMLKKLGDFSHNIIQNKPKVSPIPLDTLTKSRMVDLYSYRAHLPSPHSLDLKSVKMEPRGPDRTVKNKPLINLGSGKTMLRKAKPRTSVNPLDSLPTLDELRNTLRSNTRNLLDNPTNSNLNLFPENIRSYDIENVAKSFRKNTEKTLKGLHRKMKTSLKKPNPLEDSLAKQQELIDDMNDKLKGIHYDLNDRLTSLRESILDSTRLRTIDQPRTAANKNVMANLRKSKTKSTLPRLQTASTTNQEINANQLGLEPRHFTTPDWNRSQKMQNVAESAPTPVKVESPKSLDGPLNNSNRKLPLRQNPMSESLKEKIPTTSFNRDFTNLKDLKSPLFRTAVSRFSKPRQQNKVTISFGTAKPIQPPRAVIKIPNISPSQLKPQSRGTPFGSIDTIPIEKIPAEPKVLGKFKPLRTSAPIPSPVDEDYEDSLNNFPNKEYPLTDNKSKSSVFRETLKPDLKIPTNSNRLKSANAFDDTAENKFAIKALDRPNLGENSFLSKVRNATIMRRLGNFTKPTEDAKTEQGDMMRSPTENKSVVIEEPLKENVSYRCRMVCTKERK